MRDEFVDTCGLCDAPLRMGQRCACGDNWRAAQPAPAQSAIITPDVPPLDIHSAAARIWQALQGVDLRKQDPVPVIAQALADAAIQHVGAPAQPASAEQQPVANRGTPGLQDVRVERTIIDRYPEINPSNYDHEAERDALAADARRYRVLCETHPGVLCFMGRDYRDKDELDAAIDEYIALDGAKEPT